MEEDDKETPQGNGDQEEKIDTSSPESKKKRILKELRKRRTIKKESPKQSDEEMGAIDNYIVESVQKDPPSHLSERFLKVPKLDMTDSKDEAKSV